MERTPTQITEGFTQWVAGNVDVEFKIKPCNGSAANGLSKLELQPILQLKSPVTFPTDLNYDMLWHCSLFFSSDNEPRPSFLLQSATSGNKHLQNQPQSYVEFILHLSNIKVCNRSSYKVTSRSTLHYL